MSDEGSPVMASLKGDLPIKCWLTPLTVSVFDLRQLICPMIQVKMNICNILSNLEMLN
jgi:hypothetical protein